MSKNLNINLKDLSNKAMALVKKVRPYTKLIFIVTVIIIYSFLVFRINSLSSAEPSDDAVSEKLATTKRLKIDQSDIDKIQQLQDNSVDVQTLFKQARDNPFQE